MRASEIDGPADHSDTGTIAEDVVRVPGIYSAYNCYSAGLELGEGITDIPEIPGLRRIEPGVMLCHGVAPRPAAPLDIENALCSGIESAVRDIAQNGYLCPAVDPADIVRRAAVQNNFCSRHAHASESLSYRTVYGDCYGFAPGPDSPPDSVLSVGMNSEFTRAISHRLLYLFFEDTGRHPFPPDYAVNGHNIF